MGHPRPARPVLGAPRVHYNPAGPARTRTLSSDDVEDDSLDLFNAVLAAEAVSIVLDDFDSNTMLDAD